MELPSEEIKMRFGRCPYCRAMIYQNPKAVIYYCSKCRTPIRGKNPVPREEADHALSQIEILSADTLSVFSDELECPPRPSVVDDDGDQVPSLGSSTSCSTSNPTSEEMGASPPYRGLRSIRASEDGMSALAGRFGGLHVGSGSSPINKRVNEIRGASRRTRRPSSADSDVDTPKSDDRGRRPALSSQGPRESMNISEPSFHKDLLLALDNLRKFVAAVEVPKSSDDYRHAGAHRRQPITRRDSRLLRRLDSQLAHTLPGNSSCRDPRTSSPPPSASPAGRTERRARQHHCRPVLGGAPFVVCSECSELLQVPMLLSRKKVTKLQCGHCSEVLNLTLPASATAESGDPREGHRPDRAFSAPQPEGCRHSDPGAAFEEHGPLAGRSSMSGETLAPSQRRRQELPLHRIMGYDSPSPLLQSRRY